MRVGSLHVARAFVLLAVCGFTAGCEHDPQPKERPKDVPLTALWVGTPEGGAYYDCSSGGPVNNCTVWSDTDGNVRLSGRFQLLKQKRSATSGELHFVSADQSRIYLDKGLVLSQMK